MGAVISLEATSALLTFRDYDRTECGAYGALMAPTLSDYAMTGGRLWLNSPTPPPMKQSSMMISTLVYATRPREAPFFDIEDACHA